MATPSHFSQSIKIILQIKIELAIEWETHELKCGVHTNIIFFRLSELNISFYKQVKFINLLILRCIYIYQKYNITVFQKVTLDTYFVTTTEALIQSSLIKNTKIK